jgi:hypothetical protein
MSVHKLLSVFDALKLWVLPPHICNAYSRTEFLQRCISQYLETTLKRRVKEDLYFWLISVRFVNKTDDWYWNVFMMPDLWMYTLQSRTDVFLLESFLCRVWDVFTISMFVWACLILKAMPSWKFNVSFNEICHCIQPTAIRDIHNRFRMLMPEETITYVWCRFSMCMCLRIDQTCHIKRTKYTHDKCSGDLVRSQSLLQKN